MQKILHNISSVDVDEFCFLHYLYIATHTNKNGLADYLRNTSLLYPEPALPEPSKSILLIQSSNTNKVMLGAFRNDINDIDEKRLTTIKLCLKILNFNLS